LSRAREVKVCELDQDRPGISRVNDLLDLEVLSLGTASARHEPLLNFPHELWRVRRGFELGAIRRLKSAFDWQGSPVA
jgi:hypothetical protein